MNCMEQMRARLTVLQPVQIEIADDSHKHAGHVGASNGGGHYRLKIVSAQSPASLPWQGTVWYILHWGRC